MWPFSKSSPTPSPSVQAQITMSLSPSPSYSVTLSEPPIQPLPDPSPSWLFNNETNRWVKVDGPVAGEPTVVAVAEAALAKAALAENSVSVSVDDKIVDIAQVLVKTGADVAEQTVAEAPVSVAEQTVAEIGASAAEQTVAEIGASAAEQTVVEAGTAAQEVVAKTGWSLGSMASSTLRIPGVALKTLCSFEGFVGLTCGLNVCLSGRVVYRKVSARTYDTTFWVHSASVALNTTAVAVAAISMVNTFAAELGV